MATAAIEICEDVTDEVVEAFARLIPQLSSSSPPPTQADLEAIVASEASTIFLARHPEDGRIIGTTTLAVFQIPTGLRSWIEDVVVDEAAGRQGAGKALTLAAVAHARALGVRTVDLTSRPSREAANAMYQQLGFQLRTTNCYRIET